MSTKKILREKNDEIYDKHTHTAIVVQKKPNKNSKERLSKIINRRQHVSLSRSTLTLTLFLSFA